MLLALLLAAAASAPPAKTAIDAERAFAADAHRLGQWTAFKKWSTDDALMFVPQPIKAHEFLKGRKDPPVAVFWWPGKSFVSCDGQTAINSGPWVREWGKSVGYFTTVWKRQPDGGWKWVYDAGDTLKQPRAEGGDIQPVVASCNGKQKLVSHSHWSEDRTLAWTNIIGPQGQRSFFVWLWTGEKYENVISDQFAAPPK
jgi:ketosteroid isomerase-like protein